MVYPLNPLPVFPPLQARQPLKSVVVYADDRGKTPLVGVSESMVLKTSGVSMGSGGMPTSKSIVALFLITVPVGRPVFGIILNEIQPLPRGSTASVFGGRKSASSPVSGSLPRKRHSNAPVANFRLQLTSTSAEISGLRSTVL